MGEGDNKYSEADLFAVAERAARAALEAERKRSPLPAPESPKLSAPKGRRFAPKKITSGKTGERGWLYRFTNPRNGRVTEKRFYCPEQSSADEKFLQHLNELRNEAAGVPSTKGWRVRYEDLVSRFLQKAPITSELRRKNLKRVLEANELEIDIAADLNDVGALTAKCQRLIESKQRDANYVVTTLQPFLRQLSRWA